MAVCLLKARAQPNAVNDAGSSALHDAAARGFTWVAMCLLRGGTDPNLQDLGGCTALHLASSYGQFDTMRALLSQDADFDIVNERGETSLHCAAMSGSVQAVEVHLLSFARCFRPGLGLGSASIDIFLEPQFSHRPISQVMLDLGCAIEAVTLGKETALHIASRLGHAEVPLILNI